MVFSSSIMSIFIYTFFTIINIFSLSTVDPRSKYIIVPRVTQCLCPSSKLGPSNPLFRKRVCPSRNQRGGHTRLRVRGGGCPNSDDWRKSLALCLLCEWPQTQGLNVNAEGLDTLIYKQNMYFFRRFHHPSLFPPSTSPPRIWIRENFVWMMRMGGGGGGG